MYGVMMPISKVIFQISSTLQFLVKVRKPGIQRVPHRWPDLLRMLENCTPKLKVCKVLWEFPRDGWIKLILIEHRGGIQAGVQLDFI